MSGESSMSGRSMSGESSMSGSMSGMSGSMSGMSGGMSGGMMMNMSQFLNEPNNFFRNLGNGKFEDIATMTGTDDGQVGHGLAVLDYNNDGALDLYIVLFGGMALLYQNPGTMGENHWLQIKLVGTLSNTDGFGAVVSISAGGNAQLKEHTGANAGHMSGQNVPLHFGLGMTTLVEWVCIAWPSGQLQTIVAVPADRLLVVTEPCVTPVVPGNCPFTVGPRTFPNSAFLNHCNDVITPYCDPNATCSFDGRSNTTCTCNTGFEGSGRYMDCMPMTMSGMMSGMMK